MKKEVINFKFQFQIRLIIESIHSVANHIYINWTLADLNGQDVGLKKNSECK